MSGRISRKCRPRTFVRSPRGIAGLTHRYGCAATAPRNRNALRMCSRAFCDAAPGGILGSHGDDLFRHASTGQRVSTKVRLVDRSALLFAMARWSSRRSIETLCKPHRRPQLTTVRAARQVTFCHHGHRHRERCTAACIAGDPSKGRPVESAGRALQQDNSRGERGVAASTCNGNHVERLCSHASRPTILSAPWRLASTSGTSPIHTSVSVRSVLVK